MILTIDLPDDVAAALEAQAAARGLSVEDWLQELATQHLQSARTSEESKKPRRRISQVIADIVADAPLEELAKLPRDGASQVDHHVYGLLPKSPGTGLCSCPDRRWAW